MDSKKGIITHLTTCVNYVFQLHYLAPAKHLISSKLKELKKLINALETENRSRDKKNQPPLTYNEAYSMLNQLLGGDVISACQSANLRLDIFSASGTGGKYTIPRLSEGSGSKDKEDGNHSNGRRKGGRGGGSNRARVGGF